MERTSSIAFFLLSCFIFSTFADDASAVWSVTDSKSGNVCLLASFSGHLTVLYRATNKETNEKYVATTTVGIPASAAVQTGGSYCTGGFPTPSQRLALHWNATSPAAAFNLSLRFIPTDSGKGSMVDTVSFEFDLQDTVAFPNATYSGSSLKTVLFPGKIFDDIPVGTCYTCREEGGVRLGDGDLDANMTLAELRLEAFRTSNTTVFADSLTVCPKDKTTTNSPTTTTTTTITTPSTTTSTESSTPAPGDAKWSVKDNKYDNVCLVASFDATFTVTYDALNKTSNETTSKTATVVLPGSVAVNVNGSTCSTFHVTTPEERLALTWGAPFQYSLVLTFSRDDKTNVTNLDKVDFNYDLSDGSTFPNADIRSISVRTATIVGPVSDVTIYQAKFLECWSGVKMTLATDYSDKNFTTVADFTNLDLQAFRTSKTRKFEGDREQCNGDKIQTTTPGSTTSTTGIPISVPTYNVTDPFNRTCLLARFDLSVAVIYDQLQAADNTTKKVNGTAVGVNSGTVNQQLCHCNETHGILVIDNFIPYWQLALTFTNSSNRFSLNQIHLDFNLRDSTFIKNASCQQTQNVTSRGLSKWQAAVGHSYQCQPQEVVELSTDGSHGVSRIQLFLRYIQVQPFITNTSSPVFGTAEVCTTISDIVPIAVGCALAALVVIVLIAYVIGRRRNRARGYESM